MFRNDDYEKKSLETLKSELKALKGYDIVIFIKDIYGDSALYIDPKRIKVIECKKDYFIGENKSGNKEKYKYEDFYKGKRIFEPVEYIS